MAILQNQGWEWRQMPKNRAGLVRSPASPLIWYTSGNTAHRWYLQALLSSQELFAAGLGCIPHGKYPSAYKTRLSGGRLQQRRRAVVLADIEDDVASAFGAVDAANAALEVSVADGPMPPESHHGGGAPYR